MNKFLFKCASFLLLLERVNGVRLVDDNQKVGIISLVWYGDEGSLFGSLCLRNATVYIAGWLMRKLLVSLKCQDCRDVLLYW